MEDARRAVECGVDGVDLVIGTSSFLREYSHGKSMEMIQKTALEVIEYVKRWAEMLRLIPTPEAPTLTHAIAPVSKSASLPRTRSVQTSLIFSLSTRPSIRLASTECKSHIHRS